MYTVCTPFRTPFCTPSVHHSVLRLCTICTPSVHRLYTVCTLSVHRLYTVCTPSVHRLYTVCTPSVPHSVHCVGPYCRRLRRWHRRVGPETDPDDLREDASSRLRLQHLRGDGLSRGRGDRHRRRQGRPRWWRGKYPLGEAILDTRYIKVRAWNSSKYRDIRVSRSDILILILALLPDTRSAIPQIIGLKLEKMLGYQSIEESLFYTGLAPLLWYCNARRNYIITKRIDIKSLDL